MPWQCRNPSSKDLNRGAVEATSQQWLVLQVDISMVICVVLAAFSSLLLAVRAGSNAPAAAADRVPGVVLGYENSDLNRHLCEVIFLSLFKQH